MTQSVEFPDETDGIVVFGELVPVVHEQLVEESPETH